MTLRRSPVNSRVRAAFEKQAVRHYLLGLDERKIKAERTRIADWCKAVLAKLGERDHVFEAAEQRFRAQRYPQDSVEWDMPKLSALLKAKGVKALKVSVDDKALEQAVTNEKLTLEELAECGTPVKSWRFRVDPVKPDKE